MILFLSTNDILGGAAMVTHRLVMALRAQGVDARMLVARKDGDDLWVDSVSRFRFNCAKIAERGEIFLQNGFSRRRLWSVSTASTGCGVLKHPWVRQARTVVLGWVNQGLVSLADMDSMLRDGKRVVWWMHDLWCGTGICHIPGNCTNFFHGCGNCMQLGEKSRPHDLSARVFQKKAEIWGNCERLSKIRFLAVSRWQRDILQKSPLMAGNRIEVLGHPFPTEDFPAGEGDGKKLIVMGAANLNDPVKNLPAAVEALNRFAGRNPELAQECEAVFFGGLNDPAILETLDLPWSFAGMLSQNELVELYGRAAVVLSSSECETMGATLMEGMACGATPATFGNGGQTDIVEPGINGYIARGETPVHLAEAIESAVLHPFDRSAQHRSVARRFSAPAIARRFLTVIA